MKARVFMLTKNEQRVIVLVMLALLTAAFVRYWRAVQPHPSLKSVPRGATATPYLPEEGVQRDSGDGTDTTPPPSSQSSP